MLIRKREIGVKLEATAGTAESITSSEANIDAYGFEFTQEGTAEFLEAQNAGNVDKGIVQALPTTCTFQTKLVGFDTGTTDPAWSLLLKGCDFAASSHVFTPTLGTGNALTFGYYMDGLIQKIAGATGSFRMTLEAGKAGVLDWTFRGKRVVPTTGSAFAGTRPTPIAPRWAGSDLTIASTAYTGVKVEFDLGAQNAMIENGSDSTGYFKSTVANWDPTLVVTIAGDGAATFYTAFLAGTTQAIALTIGSTGNQIALSWPKCQLMTDPKIVDIDGVAHYELHYKPKNNANNGSAFVTATFA